MKLDPFRRIDREFIEILVSLTDLPQRPIDRFYIEVSVVSRMHFDERKKLREFGSISLILNHEAAFLVSRSFRGGSRDSWFAYENRTTNHTNEPDITNKQAHAVITGGFRVLFFPCVPCVLWLETVANHLTTEHTENTEKKARNPEVFRPLINIQANAVTSATRSFLFRVLFFSCELVVTDIRGGLKPRTHTKSHKKA